MATFTVGTYNLNILHPILSAKWKGAPGVEALECPKEPSEKYLTALFSNIILSKLDIVCMQEIGRDNSMSLRDSLSFEYTFVLLTDQKTNKFINDGMSVAFNTAKFNLLAQKGKYYASSGDKLAYGYCDLQDKLTKKIIRIATCHLDTIPGKINFENDPHLNAVKAYIETSYKEQFYALDAIVLAGDFAKRPNIQRIERLTPLLRCGYVHAEESKPGALGRTKKMGWICARTSKDALALETIIILKQEPTNNYMLHAAKVTMGIHALGVIPKSVSIPISLPPTPLLSDSSASTPSSKIAHAPSNPTKGGKILTKDCGTQTTPIISPKATTLLPAAPVQPIKSLHIETIAKSVQPRKQKLFAGIFGWLDSLVLKIRNFFRCCAAIKKGHKM